MKVIARRRSRVLFSSAIIVVTLGCHGDIVSLDAPSNVPGAAQPQPSGSPTVPGNPIGASKPVDVSQVACGTTALAEVDRRLTRRELQNTLTDLFGAEAMAAIEPQWATVPADEVDLEAGPFQRGFSDTHVEGLFAVATALGETLSKNPVLVAGYHSCASGPIDESCARNLVGSLGARAFRRPLLPEEQQQLLKAFSSATGGRGLQMMVAALLVSPGFLFHLSEDAAFAGGVKTLRGYAIAERISYATIQSSPDPELWQDAQNGRLVDEGVRRKHILRLLNSPRGRAETLGFFDHWLRISDVPAPPEAKALVGALDTKNLSGDLAREASSYVAYKLYGSRASLRDMYLGREVFPPTEAVAQIYGTRVWTEGAEPPLAPLARGLLLRAPLLATSEPMPNTILRGVRVAREFLCEEIAPPGDLIVNARQDNAEQWNPKLQGNRERVRILTADASCMVCHGTINPLGFALEDFDSLARPRTDDPVYDDAGNLVATHPLDPSATITALDGKAVKGGIELNGSIADNDRGQTCFSQQLFRHTLFRKETLTGEDADRCQVLATAEGLRGGNRPLLEVLVEHVDRYAVAPTRVD